MANLYMPATDTYESLKSLYQGFLLELDENDNPALLIKLEPALLTSIVNGCPIEIVIRNPNLLKRSCTLYIYDLPKDPFFAVAGNFGKEDHLMKGFDEILIRMALRSKTITLALYNELSHPVFSAQLNIECDEGKFHEWLYKVYNQDEFRHLKNDFEGHFYPEDEIKGFTVKLINVDHSGEEKLDIISPEYEEEWRQNPSSEVGKFSHDDYMGDGKHGNYQELALTNHFGRFFRLNEDFYVSPKRTDGTEFCDYVMIDHNGAIMFESKFVLSEKPTKRHAAITKAIGQLNKSESSIRNRDLDLQDKVLESRLKKIDFVLKICLLNDKVYLTPENTKAITTRHKKAELPIFMSGMKFFELVVALTLKNKQWVVPNVFYNLMNFYKNYLHGDDAIASFSHFSVEGLSIDELNKMGNKDHSI